MTARRESLVTWERKEAQVPKVSRACLVRGDCQVRKETQVKRVKQEGKESRVSLVALEFKVN